MSSSVWSSDAIAKALCSVHLDGSSWLVDTWSRRYNELQITLVDCIQYNYGWHRITDNPDVIDEIIGWAEETPDWRRIIESSDVAMFPPILKELKRYLMVNTDKDFCEAVNRLSYQAVHNKEMGDFYHKQLQSCKAEYGVFRFRCVIGDNLFKLLRRHLQVTEYEFETVYGECLLADPDCCDELLIEMLVSGHLRGAVRSYKIEREYYE